MGDWILFILHGLCNVQKIFFETGKIVLAVYIAYN